MLRYILRKTGVILNTALLWTLGLLLFTAIYATSNWARRPALVVLAILWAGLFRPVYLIWCWVRGCYEVLHGAFLEGFYHYEGFGPSFRYQWRMGSLAQGVDFWTEFKRRLDSTVSSAEGWED